MRGTGPTSARPADPGRSRRDRDATPWRLPGPPRAHCPGSTGEEHDRIGLRGRCGRPPRGDGEPNGPTVRLASILGDGEVPARELGTQNDAGVDGVWARRLGIRRLHVTAASASVASACGRKQDQGYDQWYAHPAPSVPSRTAPEVIRPRTETVGAA